MRTHRALSLRALVFVLSPQTRNSNLIQDFQMGRKPTHQSRKPSFFKTFLSGFEKRLRIPRQFIKHLNGKLPGKFKLRSPNGTWWRVRVKKIKEQWFFRRGWNRFVKYHSLKVGEFLVFTYKGNSRFSVTIYDSSACEKELPLAKRRRNDHEEESNIAHIKTQEHGCQVITHFTKKAIKSWKLVGEKKREGAYKIKINGRLEEVCLLETEHPHLTQFWRPRLRYAITVPRALAAETGLAGKKKILLWDPQGRSWPVNVSKRKDGRVDIRTGWADFCKGNNLAKGDACVFEFKQQETGDDTISVHIFRAAELSSVLMPQSTTMATGTVDILTATDPEKSPDLQQALLLE